jgi:hypothetical protein
MTTSQLLYMRVSAHVTIANGRTVTICRGYRKSEYTFFAGQPGAFKHVSSASEARLFRLLNEHPHFGHTSSYRRWIKSGNLLETKQDSYFAHPKYLASHLFPEGLDEDETQELLHDDTDMENSDDSPATFWADFYEDDWKISRGKR